jgi:type I restriction enzyme S subunit
MPVQAKLFELLEQEAVAESQDSADSSRMDIPFTLHPYPAYKDSGVPWLGKVPEHWEVLPGRRCLVEKKQPNIGLVETTVLSLSYGRIVVKPLEKLRGLVPVSFETYQIVDPGDIVCRPTDLQNDQNSLRFGLVRNRGIITSAYMSFRTTNRLDNTFGYLLLHAYDVKKIFYGLGSGLRQNLDWADFKGLPCLVPPLPEQTAIVRFLEHMDRRIRRVVHARQRQIKLLEEYRQALIHQAVTGQIDVRTGKPYPAYKESGVPWLGQVPEHWDVLRLKYVARLRSGESITSERIEETGDYPVYGGNGIRGFTSSFTHEGEFVLIGRQGALCGNINYANGKFWASEHAVVVHPLRKCLTHWLGELLRAMNLNQYSLAAAQPGLAVERIQNVAIPFPPIAEQEQLDQYIKDRLNTFDAAIAAARREIELLREYRERLIADVVTGKVDVREVSAQLPEELQHESELTEIEAPEGNDDEPIASSDVSWQPE